MNPFQGGLRMAMIAVAALGTLVPVVADSGLTLAGSGSNLPLTQKLLDGWTGTGPRLVLPASIGTSGAVKAVLAGQLTLGLASRPLKAEEKAAGLKEMRYARIGIVLGVHAEVPDRNITGADLVAIYAGTKTTWADGRRIIVLARETGDSSVSVIEKLVPGFQSVNQESLRKKLWEISYTDGEAFEALTTTVGALGWADTTLLNQSRESWHPLTFEGVEPSLEHLKDGKYPLWKDLSFIYLDPLPEAARQFIEFCTTGAGIALLTKAGAL